jgi:aminopeptidase N
MDAHSKVFFTELMRAHEAAHQWWGNLVMTSAYHDEWITEALANYSAILYLERTGEGKAADVLLEAYRQALLSKNSAGASVESAGPVTEGRRVELEGKPGAWVSVMYGKGTWIMRMIHARMGDDAFWKMLAELRRRYEHKNLTTEQFRALCAEFMPPGAPDRSLEAFFDQWVWGTGIPALKLTTALKGASWNGTLSQSDVDEDFSADFPVEIVTHGKTVTKWVRSSSDPVAFSVPAAGASGKLELDPENSFLKR